LSGLKTEPHEIDEGDCGTAARGSAAAAATATTTTTAGKGSDGQDYTPLIIAIVIALVCGVCLCTVGFFVLLGPRFGCNCVSGANPHERLADAASTAARPANTVYTNPAYDIPDFADGTSEI